MYRKLQYLSSLGIPIRKWVTNPSIMSVLLYHKSSKMPSPWFVQAEPSRSCNLHCPHCVPIERGGLMQFETFKSIVDTNRNLQYVKLQGLGEPLMNPHLATMAAYAKARGCRTEVISNGTICPEQDLLDCVDTYVVSMETCDPEKYASIRGISIRFVQNTLGVLRDNFDGNIGINCVLTGDTTDEDAEGIKEFAKQYGAFVTTPMMQNWLSPGQPGYDEMRNKVGDALWAHHGKFGLADMNQERWCQWAYTQAFYDYHGRLHPCCIRMSDCYDLGKDWNGLQMQTFRKERKGHSFCKNCPL